MMQRRIGKSTLAVGSIGLGCMGMSEFYGESDERESIRTIQRALDLGAVLLDTADMYGVGENEKLVGKAIAGRRSEAVIATKFGKRAQRGRQFSGSQRAAGVCKKAHVRQA